MQRNVEVDTPFGRCWVPGGCVVSLTGERVIQVEIRSAGTIGSADDHLVKIDIVGKGCQRLPRLGCWPDLQSRAEMDFAQFDAVLDQAANGLAWFFEFNRQMASIVGDSQIFSQAGIISMFGAQSIEQMNHLAGCLEQASRLGLEAELKFAPRLRGQAADMFDAFPQMRADNPQLFGGGHQFLETTR